MRKTTADLTKSKDSGNALFLILIAVALFAALSYAVTSSGRGDGTASDEKLLIAASQVLQHAAMVEQAVNRVKIINNCTDEMISFDTAAPWTGNPLSPSDFSCHLYRPEGGGITRPKPPPGIVTTPTGYSVERGLSFVGVGGQDNCRDAAFTLSNVTEDFCNAINKLLGHADDLTPVPGYIGNGVGYPWATCDAVGVTSWTFANQGTKFNGKTAFCGKAWSTPRFTYAIILR